MPIEASMFKLSKIKYFAPFSLTTALSFVLEEVKEIVFPLPLKVMVFVGEEFGIFPVIINCSL